MKSKATQPRRTAAPTIADVASHAGVSPMTVSRVVNGEPGVHPTTQARVQESIAALRYVPNQAARRLAGSELVRISVLFSGLGAGYQSELLIGLLTQAALNHVQLLVERCDGEAAAIARVSALGSSIDGVIVAPPLCDSRGLLDAVVRGRLSGLVVASGKPDPRVCSVGVDDNAAARRMTEHLVSLGHTRIGFISGRSTQTATSCRLAGFREAMRLAALDLPSELIAPGNFDYSSGLDAAETLLGLSDRPTAVFAGNDEMAAATVAVAHRLGLDVPGDLTVVGFDDTPIATTIWPELTTIRQPIPDMARSAIEMVVQQVRARRGGSAMPPRQLLMDFQLVRRQSDAAPRRRPKLRGSGASDLPPPAPNRSGRRPRS